jgi:DNA-binding SARP family transcriptional activator
VLSYLQDLALHTLVSHETDTEIWTTDELGFESLDGVKVFKGLRSLVSELEIEILKRHRMFDEEEVGNWEAHQEAWPDDPLPLVVTVIADEAGTLRNRLLAVATQGQELGLVVIAADSSEDGIRVEGNILYPCSSLKDELGDSFEPIVFDDNDREELVAQLTEDEQAEPDQEPPASPMQAAPDLSPGPVPVGVKLFGAPEIIGVPDDVGDGFGAKSRELLFFLLLHPQGVGRDQIIEALWPETDPDKGYENFKFQLRVIRRHLRNESGPTEKFIEQTDDVYRPSTRAFEVDVWEFDRLIAQAAEGGGPEALESATDLYRGELLRAVYYSWAEPLQRHFSSTFLDALMALSDERLEQGDAAGALATLRKAIDANPHSEYLYRRTMEIYGRLGRANDIRRTYSELEAALAEIEAEPDNETAETRTRVLDRLRQGPTSANSN